MTPLRSKLQLAGFWRYLTLNPHALYMLPDNSRVPRTDRTPRDPITMNLDNWTPA
jgi:hypothetical protein